MLDYLHGLFLFFLIHPWVPLIEFILHFGIQWILCSNVFLLGSVKRNKLAICKLIPGILLLGRMLAGTVVFLQPELGLVDSSTSVAPLILPLAVYHLISGALPIVLGWMLAGKMRKRIKNSGESAPEAEVTA